MAAPSLRVRGSRTLPRLYACVIVIRRESTFVAEFQDAISAFEGERYGCSAVLVLHHTPKIKLPNSGCCRLPLRRHGRPYRSMPDANMSEVTDSGISQFGGLRAMGNDWPKGRS